LTFNQTGSPDTKGWLDLLKIFAFGTYAEYKANSANLPQIDDAQAIKLKQLTVVSLACDSKVIPYDVLLTALELKDTRTLEDCIIEGMYAGLFVGKLDQKTKEFHVTETAGRDCKPGELSEMISVLKAWVEVPFHLFAVFFSLPPASCPSRARVVMRLPVARICCPARPAL